MLQLLRNKGFRKQYPSKPEWEEKIFFGMLSVFEKVFIKSLPTSPAYRQAEEVKYFPLYKRGKMIEK
jgi:hypothetical protein